ncbi:sigma-70 family RNA polymerase sigma factor [Microbacterium hominis]|uniref:Sigma-70 family RNA polymerase sigma factor n=1 Tax=Microbacterium hominis TaxID=162426 RepID=A0A7D4UGU0_9MICO|nr:sigma-70 family RNA polymerase sigma factor [Microbacterium hominis]QKJ20129.1 sigma-70 family RNA polymerase sigma factor [Microbacterium hominis]
MTQELPRESVAPADLGDADLVLRTRSGDSDAFGELWRRHYRSGITVARSVTSTLDADDLVQEAYTRIYQSIQRGGGPTGSFRAYLFTSIRNTAASWGRSNRETTIETLDAVEDPSTTEQATSEALDRSLTHSAFRSLPSRWQEVLWYTEIEQMKPAEIAPLLGMKASAVAQLAFRAREGLREAWIQAHLRSVADGSQCQWTIERLGAYARENVGRRDRRRLDEHLAECARCAIVAGEAKEVSHRLALVLLPLTVGVAGTAGYLASLQGGGVPLIALAAMPGTVIDGAVGASPGAASGSGAAAGAGSSSAAAGATATGGALSGVAASAGLVAAGLVVVGTVVAGAVMLPGLLAPPTSSDAAGASAAERGAPNAVLGDAPVSSGADGVPVDELPTPPITAPAPPVTTPAPGDDPVADAGARAADPRTDEPVAPPAAEEPSAPVDPADPDPVDPADPDPVDPVDPDPVDPGGPDAPVDPAPPSDPAAPSGGPEEDAATGLPAGAPLIGAATTSVEDSQLIVVIEVSGEPGALVRVKFAGSERDVLTLDDAGTGVVVLRPTTAQLLTDSALELRYTTGTRVGAAARANLSDLVDLREIIDALP